MPNIPTTDDIAKLPRWAKVAFAARCAQRVLPLYGLNVDFPGLPTYIKGVRRAVFYASSSAKAAKADAFVAAKANADAFDAVAAAAAAKAYAVADAFAAVAAADAAAKAADAAVAAADAAAKAADAAAKAADAAATKATVAARAYAKANAKALVRAIAADYQTILAAAKDGHWTDDTSVDQSVFGEMWPDGEPDWYREGLEWQENILSKTKGKIEISSESIENAGPDEFKVGPASLCIAYDSRFVSPYEYAQLVAALGDLVRAEGGVGLVHLRREGFDIVKSREPSAK